MTTAIKRRRGTTTQHSTFTGLEGEVTVDTTKDTVVVHDGATAGGFPLLREDLSNNSNVLTTSNTKTLTNKSIDLSTNTVTGTLSEFNTAVSDATLVSTTGTETLSNKTFTSPSINTATISGGTVNNAIIGGSQPAAGTFTDLTASGNISFAGSTLSNAGTITTIDINGGTIDGTIIGGATAAAITGTTITANTSVSTDTISEKTSAAGVTVDGVVLKDNGASLGGNLTFTGTGNRITGDFSNATAANRVWYQTSTSNTSTIFDVVPNGTGTAARTHYSNSSDPANASILQVGIQAGGSNAIINSNIAGTGTYLPMTFYTGGSERMRIDTSGNVGIGTSSPGSRLEVVAQDAIRITGFQPLQTWRDSNDSNKGFRIQTASATTIFSNDNTGGGTYTERMRIDSSGKVLVGRTTQQSGSYTVTGGVYCEGLVSNYGIGSHSGIGGAYQTNAINFQWNGSATRLWVDTTDTGSITVSSDYRIKRNIATQEQPALDRITQLRPVTYQRADYGNLFVADDVLREGFIAHELAEVIPSAVEGKKDAENQIQSLKLDALCSVMVKAIQELKAELDTVKAELATLKG
jgi:hypothetical protein